MNSNIFIVDQRQQIKCIKQKYCKITDDTLHINNLKFRIKSHKIKLQQHLYEVELITEGGSEDQLIQQTYEQFLNSISKQYRQGLQNFLTYQPDLDTSLIQRYGNEEIQEKFDQSEISKLPIINIPVNQFYSAVFVNTAILKRQQNTIDAVKKYFEIDPETLLNQRDVELVSQMDIGQQDKNQLCQLDLQNYSKYFDYKINEPKNFMKQFMNGKGFGFDISKKEIYNHQFYEKLEFFDQIKQKYIIKTGGYANEAMYQEMMRQFLAAASAQTQIQHVANIVPIQQQMGLLDQRITQVEVRNHNIIQLEHVPQNKQEAKIRMDNIVKQFTEANQKEHQQNFNEFRNLKARILGEEQKLEQSIKETDQKFKQQLKEIQNLQQLQKDDLILIEQNRQDSDDSLKRHFEIIHGLTQLHTQNEEKIIQNEMQIQQSSQVYNRKIQLLQTQLHEEQKFNENISILMEQHDRLINENTTQIQTLCEQVIEHQKLTTQQQKLLEELQQKQQQCVDQKQQQLDQSQKQVDDYGQQISQLQQTIKQIDYDIKNKQYIMEQDIKTQSENFQKQNQQIQILEQTIDTNYKDLDRLKQDKLQTESQIKKFEQDTTSKYDAQIQTLKNNLTQLQQKILVSEQQLTQQKLQLDQTDEYNKDQLNKFSQTLSDASNQINDLKQQKQDLDQKYSETQMQLQTANHLNQQYSTTLQNLTQQMSQLDTILKSQQQDQINQFKIYTAKITNQQVLDSQLYENQIKLLTQQQKQYLDQTMNGITSQNQVILELQKQLQETKSQYQQKHTDQQSLINELQTQNQQLILKLSQEHQKIQQNQQTEKFLEYQKQIQHLTQQLDQNIIQQNQKHQELIDNLQQDNQKYNATKEQIEQHEQLLLQLQNQIKNYDQLIIAQQNKDPDQVELKKIINKIQISLKDDKNIMLQQLQEQDIALKTQIDKQADKTNILVKKQLDTFDATIQQKLNSDVFLKTSGIFDSVLRYIIRVTNAQRRGIKPVPPAQLLQGAELQLEQNNQELINQYNQLNRKYEQMLLQLEQYQTQQFENAQAIEKLQQFKIYK